MSQMTADYGQRGNWRPPKREPGPNGLWPCRFCGQECKHRVMRWCSQTCRDEAWLRMSWSAMRAHILKRDADNGCTRCGAEHAGYKGGWTYARRHYDPEIRAWVEYSPVNVWPWEVDHIVPVKDGGTDDPANLRKLCHECHVRVGIEWRASKKLPQSTVSQPLGAGRRR